MSDEVVETYTDNEEGDSLPVVPGLPLLPTDVSMGVMKTAEGHLFAVLTFSTSIGTNVYTFDRKHIIELGSKLMSLAQDHMRPEPELVVPRKRLIVP